MAEEINQAAAHIFTNVRCATKKLNDSKNNPKNNPKSAKKIKLALRAANLKTVQDDPTLDQTLKMSSGTSASVSVLPVHWTHMTCSLTGSVNGLTSLIR